MKKIFTLFLCISQLSVFAQGNQSLKPMVWLKADSFNPADGYWKDVSGQNNHARFTGTFIPSADSIAINYNRAIYFDGIDDSLSIPLDLSKTSQFSVIAVYRALDSTAAENGVWHTSVGDENNEMYLTTQRSRGFQGVARYSSGNMNLPVVNIAGQFWGKKIPQSDKSTIILGGVPSKNETLKNFKGFIAEFMVYDHLLSSDEMIYVQSYLGCKYGSTMMYSDYINSTEKTVWDFTTDSLYSFSIASIGRDDGFGVNQKQAYCTSEEKFLVIGAEKIAKSNDSNTYAFKKDHFLMWGSTDKPLALEPDTADTYPNKLPLLDRKWLMKTYGNFAKDIPTELNVYVAHLVGNPKRCYLVIDRSAGGNFSLSTVEYIAADSISDEGLAYFKNIKWDNDGSGSDLFTFSFGMHSGLELENPSCFNENSGKLDIRVRGGIAPYSFTLSNDSLSYINQWTSESRMQAVNSLLYGEYTLQVKDAAGVYVLNDIVLINPEAMILSLEDEYKIDESGMVQLDASVTASYNVSYSWSGPEGFTCKEPTASLTKPGDYEVTVYNDRGCAAKKTFVLLPPDVFYNYGVYPNPTLGDYFIELNYSSETDVQIRVYNMLGELVSQNSGSGMTYYKFSNRINNSGTYLIEVLTNQSKETFKIVVGN